MQIRFTKLSPLAQAPYRGSLDAAGYDLVAIAKTYDPKLATWIFGTGLCVEIPKGYAGFLFPRSSIFKTCHMLANCVGVIDADYRGEIKVLFRDLHNMCQEYNIG